MAETKIFTCLEIISHSKIFYMKRDGYFRPKCKPQSLGRAWGALKIEVAAYRGYSLPLEGPHTVLLARDRY